MTKLICMTFLLLALSTEAMTVGAGIIQLVVVFTTGYILTRRET
jgi:hypothetical protein